MTAEPILNIAKFLYEMFWIVIAVTIGFPLTVTLGFALGVLVGFWITYYFQRTEK